MKNTVGLLALTLAAHSPLFGATRADAYLLKAKSITVEADRTIATGDATVISGDTWMTADEISFDWKSATFTFAGSVTIQAAGATIQAKEATVSAQGKRVFVLSNGKVTATGGEAFDAKAGEQAIRLFTTPFPATETQLPRVLQNR